MSCHWLDTLDDFSSDAVALIDDSEQITYGQLHKQTRRIARQLHKQYGARNYLILRAANTVRFVTTLLAIMRSGNTPVPIAADLPPEDVDYIRAKCQAVDVLSAISQEEIGDNSPYDGRLADVPALIMFTSGTTGFPKGVIISQENLRHSCAAMSEYLEYREFPSAAVVLPLHYSYALLSQVLCQLSIGGRVALFANFRNPIKFARRVTELELHSFCGVPTTYLALTTIHDMSPLAMPSVRILCSAGAAMNRGRFEKIKEIFPKATFFNNYGMTEAAPRIAYIREDDPRFAQPTCGRTMRGVEVKIIDPETETEVPEGSNGVLVVRGPNITSGYLNDPQLSEQAFTKDGYLISGDSAHMDGGYIYIHGRNDDIFNVAGEKVAPLEVERPLNHLDGVETSAVVGYPDAERGMVPIAFVKLSQPLDRQTILAGLRGHLSAIKTPQRFFEVRDFPLTPNGKLRRQSLSITGPNVTREII